MPLPILGIDEVGRGALAGPVFLGACRLPAEFPRYTYAHDPAAWSAAHRPFEYVRDSKKLSPAKRTRAVALAAEYELEYRLYSASPATIDAYGIGTCLSYLVYLLVNSFEASEVLIDGQIKILSAYDPVLLTRLQAENNLTPPLPLHPTLDTPQPGQVQVHRESKADDKYLAIALASNLAKVARDELMSRLHEEFPVYNWVQNKGYGTLAHRRAIGSAPDNPYLRQSFLGKIKSAPS